MPPCKQKTYRDHDGKVIRCPRCNSKKLTTHGVKGGSSGKSYYCKSCTRLFTLGKTSHAQLSQPTVKELMQPYVRFSKGLLVWSKRYFKWFYRLDKNLPWQPLSSDSLTDEVKIYLRQKYAKFKPFFFGKCIRYLKDHLEDSSVNPDPFTYSLGYPPCPHCGATHTRKKGKTKSNKKQYDCINCKRRFTIFRSFSSSN